MSSEWLQNQFTVQRELGLHARPAGHIWDDGRRLLYNKDSQKKTGDLPGIDQIRSLSFFIAAPPTNGKSQFFYSGTMIPMNYYISLRK